MFHVLESGIVVLPFFLFPLISLMPFDVISLCFKDAKKKAKPHMLHVGRL